MAPAYSCPKCGYSTDYVWKYNKHINKYSKCKPKEIEECLLCGKGCKVGGSTLRKHVCLADKSLEHFEMQHNLFDAVCLELKSMPDNDFQQLGLGSHQPEDMALAAFVLLYLNPKHPQYHCNVWDAHMGSVISMTTTAVPFCYNWFRILKLAALILPVSAPDLRNS